MPELYLANNIVNRIENRLPLCPFQAVDAIEESSRKNPLEVMPLPFNPKSHHPMLYHLKDIEWSIWGTLTWKDWYRRLSGPDAEKTRHIDFIQLLQKTRADVGLRGKDICFYHATEFGKSGENHLHFLALNRKPLLASNELFAERMQSIWNKDFALFDHLKKTGGAGMAVIAHYDKQKENPAASYCFKREFDEHGNEQERYDHMSKNLFKMLLQNKKLNKIL
jgi:hypothetical protein